MEIYQHGRDPVFGGKHEQVARKGGSDHWYVRFLEYNNNMLTSIVKAEPKALGPQQLGCSTEQAFM